MSKTPAGSAAPNPFFEAWNTADGVPPFERIAPEHFRDAYARALAEHDAEIAAIAGVAAPPSFDNTIGALELSGRPLERVGNVFWLLAGAHTNDALLEIEREISPQIALHWNKSIPTRRCTAASIPSCARRTVLGSTPNKSG